MKQAHNDEIPAYEKDPVFEEVFKLTPRCFNCGQPTADKYGGPDGGLRTEQLVNDKNACLRILRDNQDLVPKKLIKELVDYIDSVRRFG
tara:strand:- start:101 stop:367 length:267 start_codon:yes stop_codon:yes gene_type:complete